MRRETLALLLNLIPGAAALSLLTRSGRIAVRPEALHDFLATPSTWPRIVLSSHSVEGEGLDMPSGVGDQVDEGASGVSQSRCVDLRDVSPCIMICFVSPG